MKIIEYRALRINEVKQITGLGKSSIYKKINEGTFPKPISLSTRAVGWLCTDIERWIESRIAVSRPTGADSHHEIFRKTENQTHQKAREHLIKSESSETPPYKELKEKRSNAEPFENSEASANETNYDYGFFDDYNGRPPSDDETLLQEPSGFEEGVQQ